MIALTFVLAMACIPLAFCLGYGLAAEAIGRQIQKGAVELEGMRYLCFPSTVPPRKKMHRK